MRTRIVLIISAYLMGCTTISTNGNYFGISRSMDESKAEGFFVQEYTSTDLNLEIDDIGTLLLGDFFVEKKWRSNNDLSKTAESGYQFICTVKRPIPDEYSFQWVCTMEGGKIFTGTDSVLVADLPERLLADTIRINVYSGDVFYLDSMDSLLTQIILTKR